MSDFAVATRRAPCLRQIGRLAVRALLDELTTYPKPGLVSLVDHGSHDDMDAAVFVRSAFCLRHFFRQVAVLGHDGGDFPALRAAGVVAEARMLRVSGGVNTHRGAILMLGILAAAAGRRASRDGSLDTASDTPLDDVIRAEWSAELRAHRPDEASHGGIVRARHDVGGAIAEAASGLPHVFDVALPGFKAALRAGASFEEARVHAFFMSMAVLEDTNLLHRGGAEGLADARRLASRFIARGGVIAAGWRSEAVAIHRELCVRRLSPGGSADVLAATLFVHSLEG